MNLEQRIRLGAGLVLFAFVASHLANHALGIISLSAMNLGREVFLFVWRSAPGTLLLVAAVVSHVTLVLAAVYRRRSWRGVRPSELVQLASGLAIPPLVVSHVLANRGLHERFGFDDDYAWVLMALWHFDPWHGMQQAIVTVLAWTHGCIGVHLWLRLKPWYRPCFPPLYTAAVLTVVLGLVGFVNGGQEVEALARDPVWLASYRAETVLPPEAAGWVYATRDTAWAAMVLGVGLLASARGAQWLNERRRGLVTIRYTDGQKTSVEPGVSVLEASRRAGIPHASVCGGRGRCSTCRVKLTEGVEFLPEPGDAERRVLHRLGSPPGVRLACQLRPTHDIVVSPLLPANATAADAFSRPGYAQGAERRIAILFADLRQFTRFSERKLPYDVVFVINQYFRYMGRAVEENGGRLDKFIGDGVMALFGVDSDAHDGAQRSLAAARAMSLALVEMNEALHHDLGEPMRMGIGIDVGDVVVGEMGYRSVMSLTAIGDTVNTAARLEEANKSFGSQLVFSAAVAEAASLDVGGLARHEVTVRGRKAPVAVYVLESAAELPENLAG